MYELDTKIRQSSAGAASLDDVLQSLQKDNKEVSLEDLRNIVDSVSEQASRVLQLDKLPGCRSIQSRS